MSLNDLDGKGRCSGKVTNQNFVRKGVWVTPGRTLESTQTHFVYYPYPAEASERLGFDGSRPVPFNYARPLPQREVSNWFPLFVRSFSPVARKFRVLLPRGEKQQNTAILVLLRDVSGVIPRFIRFAFET